MPAVSGPVRQITLLALAIATSPLLAHADGAEEAQRVGLARIEVQGLGSDARRSMREALVEALTDLGAEVPATAQGIEIAEECLVRADCLRARLSGLEIDGVFSARVIRVGPIVRVAIRVHDATNGIELMTTESTAPARSFPDPSLLSGDLARGLELLMRLHPPPPPPPPPPEPLPEPAPAPASLPVEEAPAPIVATADPPGAPLLEQPAPPAASEEQEPGPWGAVGIGGVGVGGAMLLGGAAAGAWWLMLRQELSQACARPEGCSDSQYQPTLDQYHLTGYVAPILLGAGGIAAALGLVSLLVLDGDS